MENPKELLRAISVEVGKVVEKSAMMMLVDGTWWVWPRLFTDFISDSGKAL